jgi:hypothetical protein
LAPVANYDVGNFGIPRTADHEFRATGKSMVCRGCGERIAHISGYITLDIDGLRKEWRELRSVKEQVPAIRTKSSLEDACKKCLIGLVSRPKTCSKCRSLCLGNEYRKKYENRKYGNLIPHLR